jgi:hypothetical protein
MRYNSNFDNYCYHLLILTIFMLKSTRSGANFVFPLPISMTKIIFPADSNQLDSVSGNGDSDSNSTQSTAQPTATTTPISSPFIISMLYLFYRIFNQITISLTFTMGYPVYLVSLVNI